MAKVSVLYVEDDKIMQKFISNILTKKGFFVINTETKNEALEVLHKFKPDIIISDLNLPDSNHTEILKDLRSFVNKTPIIVISSYDWNAVKDDCESYNVEFIQKPINVNAFILLLYKSLKDANINIINKL